VKVVTNVWFLLDCLSCWIKVGVGVGGGVGLLKRRRPSFL
jgi:hypothetical protein